MKLWQKLWLLFAVIWVVVAGLNVMTILVFSDEADLWEKARKPAAFGLAVPALLYLILWGWHALRRKSEPTSQEPQPPEK